MGHGILTLLLLVPSLVSAVIALSSTKDERSNPRSFGRVETDATVEYLGPNNTITLWQIPKGVVRKVLVVTIGNGTAPWAYFDRTERCPLCTGLPEMRKVVFDALEHNYAVILISPLDLEQCYTNWPRDSPDLINIKSILSKWKRQQGLENVPTVAFGSSCGGRTLSTLGLDGTTLFESMVFMVSEGISQAWEEVTVGFPPTLFVHCPKDYVRAAIIEDVMSQLHALGTPTDEAKWFEVPLTPTWFSDGIPGFKSATSEAMYRAFRSSGTVLDENDFFLDSEANWQPVLRAANLIPEDPGNPGLLLFEEAIHQEIRVAYAYHVTVSRLDEKVFRWLDGSYSRGSFVAIQ